MREVNRSEPLVSLGKQGVPRGVCYSSRWEALPNQDRLTHLDDDATLLLPCILHSPYTFLESFHLPFQTG